MPQVNLSQIKLLGLTQPQFEAAVAEFVQAKKEHLTTEGVPAPTRHPLIEACVRRIPGTAETPDDFVADHVVIDDIPKQTVEQRRNFLAAKMQADATAALSKINPPLKERLRNIRLMEIVAVPADSRTAEQNAILDDHNARTARVMAVDRHLAELESQIHDLPEDMLDIWKPAPFPE